VIIGRRIRQIEAIERIGETEAIAQIELIGRIDQIDQAVGLPFDFATALAVSQRVKKRLLSHA
jgi:hypothetical protein